MSSQSGRGKKIPISEAMSLFQKLLEQQTAVSPPPYLTPAPAIPPIISSPSLCACRAEDVRSPLESILTVCRCVWVANPSLQANKTKSNLLAPLDREGQTEAVQGVVTQDTVEENLMEESVEAVSAGDVSAPRKGPMQCRLADHRIAAGCTACVALKHANDLYVANAGECVPCYHLDACCGVM